MKKILLSVCILLLTVTIILVCLWGNEKNSSDKIMSLYKYSISASLLSFTEYQNSKGETFYIQGVANMNTMVSTAMIMPKNTIQNKEKNNLNAVYGYSTIKPEKAKENLELYIEILTLLSKNADDYDAYIKLENLHNVLKSD
jgi:hypothetical protein